jgi:hypothetical protein
MVRAKSPTTRHPGEGGKRRPRGPQERGYVQGEKEMMKRVLALAAAAAVFVFVGAVLAADKAAADTVTGVIAKVSDTSITVTDKDGKDHALQVAKDAKIQCDGQACKLSDLDPKKVTSVTVTLNADKTMAALIDAKTK